MTLQAIAHYHQASIHCQSFGRDEYIAALPEITVILENAQELANNALSSFMAFVNGENKTVWWCPVFNPIMTIYRKSSSAYYQSLIDLRCSKSPEADFPLIQSTLQQEVLQKFQTKNSELMKLINPDRNDFQFSKKQILVAAVCNGVKLLSPYTSRLNESLLRLVQSQFQDDMIHTNFPLGDVCSYFYLVGRMALGNRKFSFYSA